MGAKIIVVNRRVTNAVHLNIVYGVFFVFFFFKQKTAYEMCGRDWSSDVCSSDLR